MIFNERGPYAYATSMDRDYVGNSSPEFVGGYSGGAPNISGPISSEGPILTTGEIGQTVGEGKGQGTFIESVQAAIRKGASSVELSMGASGSEPNVGPDLYTKDKRRDIRDLARANQIQIRSVHTPVQVVSNLSGFAGPERGFMDEHRHIQLNEVKKAIDFAADTTQGGAVVVHTGEFQRPFSEQSWARTEHGEFRYYEEEPERYTAYLVDDRTGRVMGEAKKTQVVYEPLYKTAASEGMVGQRDPKTGRIFKEEDWIDIHGNWIDPLDTQKLFERVPEWDESRTRFKSSRLTWDVFEDRADKWNREHADEIASNPNIKRSPEEEFYKTQYENRIIQAMGSSLYHGRFYEQEKKERDKALETLKFYEDLEKNVPKEEAWKLLKEDPYTRVMGLAPAEYRMPSDLLKDYVKQKTDSMRYTHEASAAADAQADTLREDLIHIKCVEKYAKNQTSNSYAEAGIHAMDSTRDRQLENPIFVAPENIFPEHGYGSHPDELIELVKLGRQRMVDFLTKPTIDGKPNRHYRASITREEAEQAADKHIKATLDTEHLGMWKKHFLRKSGETEKEFDQRFNGWYMDKVKEMEKAGIIGHLHIADGFGYGHANLPAGQGNMPVVDAVSYLKKKGYTGAYLSEGYGDATRMLKDTWRAFGTPIYSSSGPIAPGGPTRWSDVQHSYFGQNQPPFYVFGAYSPSNDWTLWSQTPME